MHKRFLQYLCGKSCPLRFFADRPAIPPATLGLPKIDAADQHRQLFLRERNLGLSFTRNRPAVAPFLKRFRTYPYPCAVPIDQLQPISLCVGKQKQMPTERVTLQLIAHQTIEKSLSSPESSGNTARRPHPAPVRHLRQNAQCHCDKSPKLCVRHLQAASIPRR